MSWWTYKKDKDGKVYLISSDITFVMFPIMLFMALFVAIFFANPTGTVRFLLWSGLSCLLAAKVSLFRRGIWSSWGPGQMTKPWSRVYTVGYVLIGVGTLMTIAAYRSTH
jgi:hypothetical protein